MTEEVSVRGGAVAEGMRIAAVGGFGRAGTDGRGRSHRSEDRSADARPDRELHAERNGNTRQSPRCVGVSRHHAMIKLVKDNLVLVDVASSNGTFVNGHRAMPTNRYNLVDGDTLTVGRLTLQIRFHRRNRI